MEYLLYYSIYILKYLYVPVCFRFHLEIFCFTFYNILKQTTRNEWNKITINNKSKIVIFMTIGNGNLKLSKLMKNKYIILVCS